ncbi:GIY-YIG nuclease family protein [Sneathiella sp. HT1-7]|nr:GIY-YIG nuclease family protein [Sneathiella sp. HT1-7]MCC3304823.1 GIY-YIG nuclease family protein [Sneathiella sp. HT1-7]
MRRSASEDEATKAGFMHYVYILQSIDYPERFYVGLTTDLNKRLAQHNNGESVHTNKFNPWKIQTVIRFEDASKAEDFEKYLKSGSGRAFAKKHF